MVDFYQIDDIAELERVFSKERDRLNAGIAKARSGNRRSSDFVEELRGLRTSYADRNGYLQGRKHQSQQMKGEYWGLGERLGVTGVAIEALAGLGLVSSGISDIRYRKPVYDEDTKDNTGRRRTQELYDAYVEPPRYGSRTWVKIALGSALMVMAGSDVCSIYNSNKNKTSSTTQTPTSH